MTSTEKPLSERFREAYDFGFIKLQHRGVFDALEALMPEFKALEAERDQLKEQIELDEEQQQKEITEVVSKNGELQTKLWQTQERFGDLEKRAESAEAEVKRLTEQRFFEIKCNPELEKRLTELALDNLEKGARLAKAQEAMIEFHCSTFKDFPDEAHCGSPKTRTCAQYYLCEAMNKALTCASCTKADVTMIELTEHVDAVEKRVKEGDERMAQMDNILKELDDEDKKRRAIFSKACAEGETPK